MTDLCPCRLEVSKWTSPTDSILADIPHVLEDDRKMPWWTENRYYQYYAGLAELLGPKSVLELGVRLGYSLVAMVRGSGPAGGNIEMIVGVDNECGIAGSQELARQNIEAAGHKGILSIVTRNVFEAPAAVSGHYDLVHVDADHSPDGTMFSIWYAWALVKPGGVLVVDDAADPGTRNSIEVCRRSIVDRSWDFYFDKVFTGWWVAGKRG